WFKTDKAMQKKLALVTGANRGIGYAVVQTLLERGVSTILTSRKAPDGQKAVQELQGLGDLHYHPLDVDDPASVESIQQFVSHQFGKLDILVNNAGINYDTWQSTVTADLQVVRDTLETNLLGPWRLSQAFIPLMKKQAYGRIVNVSSGAGALSGMGGGTPAYGISKAALNALTIKLAAELKDSGILVNAVCPGWVRTDMGGSGARRSPEKGAETIVWLAELPKGGPSGGFFRDKQPISF
ncbi:MAG: SDR family oxidoreductase, partial [Bacteroidota bacterium]